MNRWTPADGPIEDALKDLPDDHPVTIRWAGSTTTTAHAIRHLGADHDLFGNPSTEPEQEPAQQPSAGARHTSRQHAALAAGRHPLQGGPIPNIPDATCGNCAYRIDHYWRPDKYHKCALAPFPGQRGTAIRVTWPACNQWETTND